MGLKGFKQTEVGRIPNDWTLVPVGSLLSFKNGLNKSKAFFGHGTPIVNYMDVYTKAGIHRADLVGKVFVSTDEQRKYSARAGDVFFTRTSETTEEIGVAAVLLEDIAGAVFSGFVLRGRPISDRLAPAFAKYCFASAPVRHQVVSTASYTTRALTNGRLLSRVLLPLPANLAEQEAIAGALSDADAVIESLEQLIAKKRLMKQGVMHELLTGERRLPGFEEEWNEEPLGSLGTWLSGGTPSKKNEVFWSGSIPWVSPKDMKRPRLFDAIDHVAEAAIGNGTRLLPKGAVVVVVRGMILAHSAPVARCELPMAFNQDIKALVVREGVDSDFLLWWLVAHERLLLSKTAMSTHGTKRLPTEDLFALEIPVPTPDEQTAIALTISDMDEEISALGRRLQKARQIKQGMMQQLLTGRIRLT